MIWERKKQSGGQDRVGNLHHFSSSTFLAFYEEAVNYHLWWIKMPPDSSLVRCPCHPSQQDLCLHSPLCLHTTHCLVSVQCECVPAVQLRWARQNKAVQTRISSHWGQLGLKGWSLKCFSNVTAVRPHPQGIPCWHFLPRHIIINIHSSCHGNEPFLIKCSLSLLWNNYVSLVCIEIWNAFLLGENNVWNKGMQILWRYIIECVITSSQCCCIICLSGWTYM